MSTINQSNGSSGNCSTSSSTDDDFKFLVHSLKCCLSASDRFIRFIQLSSSHGSMMADNLPTIQSILLEIILKLLSSCKFKFTSLIASNDIDHKTGFIEMCHQMEKFFMHDHHHWNLIIEEIRQNLDKLGTVNKAKYEDLIYFTHLSLDHITKNNIRLDLQSFAILFNIMASFKSSSLDNMHLARLPCSQLNFSPLSIIPKRRSKQVKVIKAVNCVTPPGTPITIHSKFSLSTHRRRLNFDALDEEENGTAAAATAGRDIGDNDSTLIIQSSDEKIYQLIAFPPIKYKNYSRPEGYSYQPHNFKSPLKVPLELQVDHLPDPRNVNRMVIVHNPNQKRSIRTLHSNGTITVKLSMKTNDTDNDLDSDTIVIPEENPKPAKRKRIVWDLD